MKLFFNIVLLYFNKKAFSRNIEVIKGIYLEIYTK